MNRLLYLACLITRTDPEIMSQCNHFDRMTTYWNAIGLISLIAVSVLVWTVFFHSFYSLHVAVLLASLISAVIAQLEAAMAASDWDLRGVLHDGGRGLPFWSKVGARLLFALALSVITAKGATLALFSETIKERMQIERAKHNAVLEHEYEARKNEIKTRLLEPIDRELKEVSGSKVQTSEALRSLDARREEARRRASEAYIEAGREVDGVNRRAGAGPRYRDAQRRQKEAEAIVESTAREIERMRVESRAIDARIEKLNHQRVEVNTELQARWLALDDAKVGDPRWMPERDDALRRYLALNALKSDDRYGHAVVEFNWLTQLLLLTLELSFVLNRVVFAPASVYTVRIIWRTRAEASEVATKYAQEIHEKRQSRPRGNLRIVGGSDSDAPNTTNGEDE